MPPKKGYYVDVKKCVYGLVPASAGPGISPRKKSMNRSLRKVIPGRSAWLRFVFNHKSFQEPWQNYFFPIRIGAFAADKRIPLISVTGSTAVGRKIAQIVGNRLCKTIEDAIHLNNDVPQGLSSCIFTENLVEAEKIMRCQTNTINFSGQTSLA